MSWIGVGMAFLIYTLEVNAKVKGRNVWKNIFMSSLLYLGIAWLLYGNFYTANVVEDYEKAVLQMGTGIVHFIFLGLLVWKRIKNEKT